MRRVNYETEAQREQLILEAEQKGEVLKEDAILLTEKYLIFDVPTPQPPTQEERLAAVEDALLALL